MKVVRYKNRTNSRNLELKTDICDKVDKILIDNINKKVSMFKRIGYLFTRFDDWLDRHKKETRFVKVILVTIRIVIAGAGTLSIGEFLLHFIDLIF